MNSKKADLGTAAAGAVTGAATQSPFMQTLMGKALPWGLGLAAPGYLAGRALSHSAKQDAKSLINHARNQALLVGGLQAGAGALGGMFGPKGTETYQEEELPTGEKYKNTKRVTKISNAYNTGVQAAFSKYL